MAKKINPAEGILDGALSPEEVRAKRLQSKSSELLDRIQGNQPVVAPKSMAEKMKESGQAPAPAKVKSAPEAPAQPAPEPEPQKPARPVEVPEPASAPFSKNKGGRPEEYEDLQQVTAYLPTSMIDAMDRIVFERKLAGDKKFNRSWFMREALITALSKE